MLDQQFHMLLCEASGTLLLRALFRAMLATVNRFIGTMYVRIVSAEDQAKQLHDAHLEIVQALTEGDENAAIQGIWRHFQVVEEAILAMPSGPTKDGPYGIQAEWDPRKKTGRR